MQSEILGHPVRVINVQNIDNFCNFTSAFYKVSYGWIKKTTTITDSTVYPY